MTPPVSTPPEAPVKKAGPLVVLLQLVIVIAVLGGGIFMAKHLMQTGPEAKPRKFVPSPHLVDVETVHYQPFHLSVQSMGTVVPATEIDLTAGVGGEILEAAGNFVPGGYFAKGEMMLQIDPTDFTLNIRQLESDVRIAENELTAEMGNQRIAAKEFALLGQQVSEEERQLMLRAPQLATKKANLQTTEARLAQARRDLDRTRITAPFNAVIRSQAVHAGARVTATTPLATITGTDEFYLRLLVPVSDLKWIVFPEDHGTATVSTVKIFINNTNDTGAVRTGTLFRLAPDLEEQGRMAVIYATIPDPLCLLPENKDKPKLLLGSYVRTVIEGTELSSVVPIARSHLRDHNTVWIMSKDSKLEIRPVDIVAKTPDTVLIKAGVTEGEKLITSNLSSPVDGTLVKLMGSGPKDNTRPVEAVVEASKTKPGKEVHQ